MSQSKDTAVAEVDAHVDTTAENLDNTNLDGANLDSAADK